MGRYRLHRTINKDDNAFVEYGHRDLHGYTWKQTTQLDHRMIARSFVAVPPLVDKGKSYIIDHIDGDRANRNIGSKTVRNMLTMSHYKYRQRLEWAATRYPGRYVLVTEEPGTSKTCTNCGYWNSNLGSDEVYCCGGCGICVGRDLAGARNNFFSEYGKAVLVGWDGNGD